MSDAGHDRERRRRIVIPEAVPAGTSRPTSPLIVSATKSSNSSGTDPPISHR
jgi:hypothetical protein